MQAKPKKRARKTRRCGPKYWIVAIGTLGMLVAYCPANRHRIVLGKARLNDELTTNQVQRQLTFDIPSGTLESVLIAFQQISGIEVVIPNAAMRSISSPGVKGRFSLDQALREILRDTGISIASPTGAPSCSRFTPKRNRSKSETMRD